VPRADSARAAGPQPPAEGTPSAAALRRALARSEAALRRASARRDALYAEVDANILLPAWLDNFVRPGFVEFFGAPLPRVCSVLAGGLAGAPVVAVRLEHGKYVAIDVHALNYVWRGAARTCEEWYSVNSCDIYAMASGQDVWGNSGVERDGNAVARAAEKLKGLRGVGADAEASVMKVLEQLPDEQLWLPALALSAFDLWHGCWWEPPPELLTGKRAARRRSQRSPSIP
jgi:hypothetical protein